MSTIHPNNPADLPPDMTPNEPAGDVVLGDHTYDGIQEYDNPIPGWWKWLFIATIVFTPIYIMWFHAPGQSRDLIGQYERAYAANLERKFGDMPALAADPGDDVLRYMNDPDWLAVGVATFKSNCVSCHGAEGQGGQGPNLTDEYYVHIQEPADIVEVLNNGAAGGAMPAWSNTLHPNAIVLTAAYVAQMRGQNLPGNPPEGEVIPAWDE
jgi:cytochrome c oxidase cbb3-type subunit 3